MCERVPGGRCCVGGHILAERMPYATCRHVTSSHREYRTGVKGEWFPSSFTFSIKGHDVRIQNYNNVVKERAEESRGGKGPILWVRCKRKTTFNRQCNKKHGK